MIDVNQLKSLMDLYRANVRDPNNWPGKTNSGFQPVSFDHGGDALDWATGQMEQQPNFFATDQQYQIPTYRQPATYSDRYDDPVRRPTLNFLATLLKGR